MVSDLDTGRPIWFGDNDRSEANLDLFYATLSPKNKTRLKFAVMDLWKAFRKSTLGHAPLTLIVTTVSHPASYARCDSEEIVKALESEEIEAVIPHARRIARSHESMPSIGTK